MLYCLVVDMNVMNGAVNVVGVGMGPVAPGVSASRAKEFQMELLMEKLRTKTSQYKTLMETSKGVRMAMLDKRWALDLADKAILQKCLDSLQHSIKVCSLQSLVERLECLSRQLGLKFMVGQSGVDLFISSDMFYLEILLEQTGAVKDVKIHHEGKVEQQSCEELVSCISRGDFNDFTAQLEGLTAMYQLNAEKKVKCRAFGALSALETDLATLGIMQATKDPWAAVHKSLIGLVQNRRGGHAMKLTYFVSPYDAACCPNGILTLDSLNSGTGLSAQVMLESAATHKLQLSPLLSRQQTNGPPIYAPLGATNSTTLPARFVLKLSKPMVICETLLNLMGSASQEGLDLGSPAVLVIPPSTDMKPLLAFIAQNSSTSDVNPNKGLFVTLPDQNQCYFLTESRTMKGCLVSSVPFTHPAQVPQLITRLRQQALFNALISSCVRPNSKQDLESSIMVEVSALSWQHISVLLEKPGEGGMATLELELPECGSAPRVTLYCGGSTTNGNSVLEERLSRVVARTLSIPLVVRALILSLAVSNNAVNSRWERQGFSGAQGGPDPGGAPTPHPHPSPHQGNYLNSDGQFNNQQDVGNSMSSMMGNGTPMEVQTSQVSQAQVDEKKSSKKRKVEEPEEVWRVKKSKPMMPDVLLDSSSSQSESGEESDVEEEIGQLNNSSNDEEDQGMSPSSAVGFGSDIELSGLDPVELMMGSSNENKTSGSDFENSGDGDMNDSQDVDEIVSTPSKSESKKHKQKNRDHRSSSSKMSTSTLLMELTEGGGLSASVSITPVSSNPPTPTSCSPSFSSVLGGINLDRRPGIEIIPISPNTQPTLPSSITITPISSSQAKSMDDRHRSDRKTSSSGKSSKSSSSEHGKEKKKKKKREDAMGPPDKLPPKQDPLTKPVSVSIKPTDGSHSPLSIRASSPNTFSRKFSPSPTHGRSVSITKSNTGSPGSVKSLGKPSGSSSHHSSPRHSPVQCSPKHAFSGYSSPKNHGTSSPKHSSSSGSSGKPSMSTLKSAATGSPSSKSSSGYELSKLSKSSGKESSSSSSGSSSREKDRKSSSGLSYSSSRSNSPKLKSSSVKLKQLDLSVTGVEGHSSTSAGESLVSPGLDLSKSASSSQLSARNRKGSLSAVIDKLKSAQHCSETDMMLSKSSSSNSNNKERNSSNNNKSTDSKNSSSSSSSKLSDSSKNQEYMVKPSSDGMKITINKTRTKDSSTSSKSSSFSGNSSSSGSGTSSSVKQSSSSAQSATGSGSPKTHTGLKPGVISGPASKKPQVLQSSKSGTSTPSSGTPVSSSGSPGMSTVKTSSNPSGSSSTSKIPFTKSSSSSSLSSSASKSSSKISTGSPKMSSSATDLSKQSRDREREREKSRAKGSSDKSIFSSNKSAERRSSPAPTRDEVDGERAFKMLSQPNFFVEGLIKTLDTSKYQIPKLSARASSDDPNKPKSTNSDKSSSGQGGSSDSSRPKLVDYMGRSQDSVDAKYQFQHGSNLKSSDQTSSKSQPATSTTPSKTSMNLTSSSPKLQTTLIPLLTSPKLPDNNDNLQPANFSMSSLSKSQSDTSKDTKSETKSSSDNNNRSSSNQSSSASSKDESSAGKIDFQKSYPSITVCSAETINQSIAKQLENKSFTVPQVKSNNEERKLSNADHSVKPSSMSKLTATHPQESSDVCLDFSSSSSKPLDMKNKFQRRHTPPLMPTQSPSLSVHIVKSPSPHSSSPCITDDELMDEAIVGPGK